MTSHGHHHSRDPAPVAGGGHPCEADAGVWVEQWMPRGVWLACRDGAVRHRREAFDPSERTSLRIPEREAWR